MIAHAVNPILNVSDFKASVEWFEKLGWKKVWDWGDPPSFGAVRSGNVEIFLCLGGQGGRGRGTNKMTFGEAGGETGDKGVWMEIWVDNVDEVHAECVKNGIEVVWPPTDMEWGAREMHIRHPDGHVFRIGHGIGEKEERDHH